MTRKQSYGVFGLLGLMCLGVWCGVGIVAWNIAQARTAAPLATATFAATTTLTPTPTPTATPLPQPSAAPTRAPQPPSPTPVRAAPTQPPASPTPRATLDVVSTLGYLNQMKPILEEVKTIVERDVAIVQANSDTALCDGRITADGPRMDAAIKNAQAIQPPTAASGAHNKLIESFTHWREAISAAQKFCETRNPVNKLEAVGKALAAQAAFIEALTQFQRLATN